MSNHLATAKYPKAHVYMQSDTAQALVAYQNDCQNKTGIKPSVSHMIHALMREALKTRGLLNETTDTPATNN